MSLTLAQLLYPTFKTALRGTVTAKAALGFLKRFAKTSARPGAGSKVTSGPLKVGKAVIYGKTTGSAARVAAGVGVGGVGIATVASHRPSTRSAPAPLRSAPAATSTSTDRKCCPAGTKRMVCFKRGKVKGKPHAAKPTTHRTRSKKARRVSKKKHGGVSKRPVSAKQAAARKRFAAAARSGKIRKGSKL